jgi:hypothetical protein
MEESFYRVAGVPGDLNLTVDMWSARWADGSDPFHRINRLGRDELVGLNLIKGDIWFDAYLRQLWNSSWTLVLVCLDFLDCCHLTFGLIIFLLFY